MSIFKCALSDSEIADLYNSSQYCADSRGDDGGGDGDTSTVGMLEKVSDDDLSIYPNPTDGILLVDFSKEKFKGDVFFKLYDIKGQIINTTSTRAESSTSTIELDYSNFNKGTYFLRVTSGDKSSVKRVVLQ